MKVHHLLPRAVLQRITDHEAFHTDSARYTAMPDDALLRATESCLRTLDRLSDLDCAGPDGDLQLVLVPELWERIRAGTRDGLRRITSTLAEYHPDHQRPSPLALRLSPEVREHLRCGAEDLRARIAYAAQLDVGSIVDQVRFAIAGSRAAGRWAPTDFVYAPGFVYRVVPAIVGRMVSRAG